MATDISVLLSTRNRSRSLLETLRSMTAIQATDFSWEVIVVDNGSTDNTKSVLAEFSKKLDLVQLDEPTPGKNRALNRALAVASGSLFVFTDDDVVPHPDWLREFYVAANRWPDDAVFGGSIEPSFPDGTPEWVRSAKTCPPAVAFSQYHPRDDEGPTQTAPFGPNFAVRRELFSDFLYSEDIGPCGSDYAMGSETELLSRLAADGHRFIFVPSAMVEHVIRPDQTTLAWLLGRFYRYGRGRVRRGMHRKAPKWFGVPRTQWKKLPAAWARYTMTIGQSDERRFLVGREYYFLRGTIAEHRRGGGGRVES